MIAQKPSGGGRAQESTNGQCQLSPYSLDDPERRILGTWWGGDQQVPPEVEAWGSEHRGGRASIGRSAARPGNKGTGGVVTGIDR